VIINRSALDRGMFRSTSVKKYISTINKNQSTSQNDQFMKPDPSKVKDMKPGSYDKLNDKGFVPEETPLVNGDVIIGKVSPIQATGNTGKEFKDGSEIYKSHIPGVVDRVYSDIYNHEGYEMIKMRVRSERTPIIGDKFCCFSPSHSLLTAKGWKDVAEITMDDMVACLNDNGEMEYKHPLATQEYDYNGNMYEVSSNQVDLHVTPNHRMYVATRTGDYKFELAEEIINKRRKYIKNVESFNADITHAPRELKIENGVITGYKVYKDNVVEKEFDIEPWLRVFGIWIAEGSVSGGRSISFAAHKGRVKECLDENIPKLGYEVHKYKDKTTSQSKDSYNFFSSTVAKVFEPLKGSVNKYLPEWVWYLNKDQCRILIESMVLGDGHYMKDTSTVRYDTSSTKLRDDLQRLCLHAGWSANSYLKCEKGHTTNVKSRNGLLTNETITTTTESYRLTIIKTQNNPLVNKNIKTNGDNAQDKYVPYTGKVYCCTTPGIGAVYVRRNGKPVWCGQSRHGQKGTIGITLPQADMPFSERGISPDLIMNPNAIPSRMTVGQFVECLTGKVGAIKGEEIDGTPFSEIDIAEVKKELESLGYYDDGTEELYNGMSGKKMKVRIFIGPTYYMRLKHMVSDKMHCLTMDHEVLTESGWKTHDKLSLEDKVATLKDGKLVYDKIKQIFYYPDFEGNMYRIKNQQIDLKVTENHRMYVSKCQTRKRVWSDYDFELAKDIVGKHRKYKKDAVNDNDEYQFVLPEYHDNNNIVREAKELDMDSWLWYFGFWIAEGWTQFTKDSRWKTAGGSLVTVSQVKEPTKSIAIQKIKDMGYNPYVREDKIIIHDIQLYNYMKEHSKGAPNKELPEWVWKLSQSQCRTLIDGLIAGDGTFRGTSQSYYTSSVKLADQFMRLCLHAGWSANKYVHLEKGNKTIIKGREITSNYDMHRLSIVKGKNCPAVNHGHTHQQNVQEEEVIHCKEPVFCISVPSEVFYVRRNGLPVWTGNSRARGPRTLLTRQAPEGRSRDGGLRVGEMERDTIIAHGMAMFLKERLLETADAYTTYVCDKCGMFAQRMLKKDLPIHPTKHDVYYCPACKNKTEISKIMIPYAFKLLLQELMAMNVLPRIRIKKNIYSQF